MKIIFRLLSAPFYLPLAAIIGFLLFSSPPRFEVIQENFQALSDDGGETIVLDLAIKNKRLQFTPFFPILLTSRDDVLLKKDKSSYFEIKAEYNSLFLSDPRYAPDTPTWKYSQGIILLLPAFLFFYAGTFFLRLSSDFEDWREAKRLDTFASYRKFLSSSQIWFGRTLPYKSKAKNRLRKSASGFARLLKILNYNSPNSPFSSIMIRSLEQLSETPRIGFFFGFKRNISLDDRANILENSFSRIKSLQPNSNINSKEAVEERLNTIRQMYKDMNIRQPVDFINLDFISDIEIYIKSVLIHIFNYFFSEELFYASDLGEADVYFLVSYNIRDNEAIYTLSNDKRPPEESAKYTGIAVDWNIEAKSSSDPRIYADTSFVSTPAKQFSSRISDESVFKSMLISAFVEMGKTVLAGTGIVPSDASANLSRIGQPMSETAVSALIKEISRKELETALRDHADEIEELVQSIQLKLEMFHDAFLSSVVESDGSGSDFGGDGG